MACLYREAKSLYARLRAPQLPAQVGAGSTRMAAPQWQPPRPGSGAPLQRLPPRARERTRAREVQLFVVLCMSSFALVFGSPVAQELNPLLLGCTATIMFLILGHHSRAGLHAGLHAPPAPACNASVDNGFRTHACLCSAGHLAWTMAFILMLPRAQQRQLATMHGDDHVF